VKRYTPFFWLALFVLVAAQAGATDVIQNLIQNGNFQSGDFTDWSLGTTGNGSWGTGFPVVTGWPLGGMNAAEGQVGGVNFNGQQEGGILRQNFESIGGPATISMDWLVSDPFAGDLDGGEFTLYLNTTQIAQIDSGQINQGQILNGVLTAKANLINGTNTLDIYITRPFITRSGLTPLQYVTGVDVEGKPIPEPGSLVLMGSGVLGLTGVLRRKLC
jgi:hypothetical protein